MDNIESKIQKLEKAIASPATPDAQKAIMKKTLESLKSQQQAEQVSAPSVTPTKKEKVKKNFIAPPKTRRVPTIAKMPKSVTEQFEELRRMDPVKIRSLCQEIVEKDEKRKQQAADSREIRESKEPSTRAVESAIRAMQTFSSMAEDANLTNSKKTELRSALNMYIQVVAKIKSILGGGKLSKEQQEEMKKLLSF